MTETINSNMIIRGWLQSYLDEGNCAFDIGANRGVHTREMNRLVGSKGKVVSFEPVLENLKLLYEIQREAPNLRVEPYALGESIGNIKFYVDTRPGLSGVGSSIHKLKGLIGNSFEVTVPLITLDSWMDDNPGWNPDLIKIDVEGSELHVFRGAANYLQNNRPVLIFEFWETWMEKIRPIFEFLTPGYTFRKYGLDEDAYDYYNRVRGQSTTDILCLPKKSINRLNTNALFA